MAVSTDIVRTWRGPAAVFRDLLAQGRREDRALVYLMAGNLIVFLSRLPALQREAVLGQGDLTRDAAYAFFGLLIVMPLLFYGLAEIGRLGARIAGLRMEAFAGRLALFWAWLAASPALLLYGLLVGLNGSGEPGTRIVGALWLAAFLWFWVQGLRVAGGRRS